MSEDGYGAEEERDRTGRKVKGESTSSKMKVTRWKWSLRRPTRTFGKCRRPSALLHGSHPISPCLSYSLPALFSLLTRSIERIPSSTNRVHLHLASSNIIRTYLSTPYPSPLATHSRRQGKYLYFIISGQRYRFLTRASNFMNDCYCHIDSDFLNC